ncbi:hypothetical protein [Sulfurospirillum sp. 1612]|uniref:hypothetical protein n=1 Tax=Sulfurospirillum sp. 1612 TaxID=3094835 RepID=UPI002F92AB82
MKANTELEMTFNEAWIEYDYNPFITFDTDEKVKSLNQEAQYLLGEVSPKKIFELAKTYASMSYGFKTTILDLNFGPYTFYAITVGYLDESEIGIKLYKKAAKKLSSIDEYGEIVNLYSLLDLCISASSASRSHIKHTKVFDPTFPEIRLKIEDFTRLLNKIYSSYLESDTITSKLMLNTGEYIKFDNKKYPIFSIYITGERRDKKLASNIEEISQQANSFVQFKDNTTILSSALVSGETGQ